MLMPFPCDHCHCAQNVDVGSLCPCNFLDSVRVSFLKIRKNNPGQIHVNASRKRKSFYSPPGTIVLGHASKGTGVLLVSSMLKCTTKLKKLYLIVY